MRWRDASIELAVTVEYASGNNLWESGHLLGVHGCMTLDILGILVDIE